MLRDDPQTDSAGQASRINQRFFDALWSRTYLVSPERFNTWPLISELASRSPRRLEIGPGLRPRFPIEGTHFVDLSRHAVELLTAARGIAAQGEASELPYPDGAFDLVCAFDVIEHTVDDARVFSEISRVLAEGGVFILAVPLHKHRWTNFDTLVGHFHRYDPPSLVALLAQEHLIVERSAVYGMQPYSMTLSNLTAFWMRLHPRISMFCHNRILLPLSLRWKRPLHLTDGLIETSGVDEVLIVCRRVSAAASTSS